MNILNKKIALSVSRHGLFWCAFFSLLFIFAGKQAFNKNFFFVDLPITLIYSYLVAYLIIPFFLKKNKIIVLLLSVFALSLALSYIRLLNYDYLYYSMYSAKLSETEFQLSFPILLLNAKDFSFGMIIFLATKFTVNWLQNENKEVRIEMEQMETEVKILKNQVDPHFLFNTMNNLYSLSVSRNENTRKAIKKMWGLMDFMARESNLKEIKLEREIQLISDYVELERLRYGDRLEFQLNLAGNFSDYRIPPMILYPFVENCFKHGCSGDPKFPWISISITEMRDKIRFIARNSIPPNLITENTAKNSNSGIENIKKRLHFQLSGRYKLAIERKNLVFEVRLDIEY